MAKKTTPNPKAEPKLRWEEAPDPHDYPAARDYLSLFLESDEARLLVERLEKAPIIQRKAKDLLRASRLHPLSRKNPEVASDLAKVARGEPLSPVLLVRGDLGRGVALVIADGYHRICASYLVDLDAEIPCRVASLKPALDARA